MSKPAGSAARRSAASTIIAARSRCRRGNRRQRLPSSVVRVLRAPMPAGQLEIESGLHSVNGGLLVERERHAAGDAACDIGTAEIDEQIFGLERQPLIDRVFQTAAGGPAVLVAAHRRADGQTERGGAGGACRVAVNPAASGVEQRTRRDQIADAAAYCAEPVELGADISGSGRRR